MTAFDASRYRVLCVDDEPNILSALRRMLGLEGYQVSVAESGEKALQLLRDGLRKGLVSDRLIGQWPRNVWSVTDGGIAMEAQLENPESGTYHGYPMPDSDPLSESVIERWEKANG